MKAADTNGQLLYDYISIKYLKQVNPQIKQISGYQGFGIGKNGGDSLMGQGFLSVEWKYIKLGIDRWWSHIMNVSCEYAKCH